MPVLSASQIAGYASKAGVTGQNVQIATAIALAESGGDTDKVSPQNRNGTYDFGTWQINGVHKDLLASHNWRDPADNAAMMFIISNGGTNWKPWASYTSGAYLTHYAAANVSPDTSGSGSVITASNNEFSAMQNFAKLISDPRTWQRLGMVLGGSVMILVAIHKSVPVPIPSVAKLAAKVVV